MPKEILKDRLIRRKKPWAVAAAATVLLACGISFGTYSHALSKVSEDKQIGGNSWGDAQRQAAAVAQEADGLQAEAATAMGEFQGIDKIGWNLTGNVEGRIKWLELLRAVNQCLPPYPDEEPPPKEEPAAQPGGPAKQPGDPAKQPGDPAKQPGAPATQPSDVGRSAEDLAREISELNELHITGLQCRQMPELSGWYTNIQGMKPIWYEPPDGQQPRAPVDPAAGPVDPALGADLAMTDGEEAVEGPQGTGWVVTLIGHHYHNSKTGLRSAQYVQHTLLRRLQTAKVIFPTADRQGVEAVSTEDLGISYPVLVNPGKPRQHLEMNAGAGGEGGMMAGAGMGGSAVPRDAIKLMRFDFVVQFCWQPRTPTERLEIRETAKNPGQEQIP